MKVKDKNTGETVFINVEKVIPDGSSISISAPVSLGSLAELNQCYEDAPEEKKYGGRVPKEMDKYYYIEESGQVIVDEWNDTDYDRATFEYGNGFWTIEEAEKEAARRKAYVILKEDTKGFKPDWECNSLGEYKGHSYGVYYCRPSRRLLVNQCGAHEVQDGIRFATEEDAKASIKAHEKEWKTWLGVEV